MQQRSERNQVKNAATSHQIERRQSVDDLRREMSVSVFAITRKVAYNVIVLITACNCEYTQGTCMRMRSPAFKARFFGIVLLITTVCAFKAHYSLSVKMPLRYVHTVSCFTKDHYSPQLYLWFTVQREAHTEDWNNNVQKWKHIVLELLQKA